MGRFSVRLICSEKAERRLRSIHNYIAEDNPDDATRVVNAIYEKVQLLRTVPQMGQRYLTVEDREVRGNPYGHDRIPDEVAEDEVRIIGVYHATMDVRRWLR